MSASAKGSQLASNVLALSIGSVLLTAVSVSFLSPAPVLTWKPDEIDKHHYYPLVTVAGQYPVRRESVEALVKFVAERLPDKRIVVSICGSIGQGKAATWRSAVRIASRASTACSNFILRPNR